MLVKDKDGTFRALPLQEAEHFARLPAREARGRTPAPISVSLWQEQALVAAKDELLRAAERKNLLEQDLARDRADRFAEDCLLEGRQKVEKARREWEAARKDILHREDPSERLKARARDRKSVV